VKVSAWCTERDLFPSKCQLVHDAVRTRREEAGTGGAESTTTSTNTDAPTTTAAAAAAGERTEVDYSKTVGEPLDVFLVNKNKKVSLKRFQGETLEQAAGRSCKLYKLHLEDCEELADALYGAHGEARPRAGARPVHVSFGGAAAAAVGLDAEGVLWRIFSGFVSLLLCFVVFRVAATTA
jgi:hypothetical protein